MSCRRVISRQLLKFSWLRWDSNRLSPHLLGDRHTGWWHGGFVTWLLEVETAGVANFEALATLRLSKIIFKGLRALLSSVIGPSWHTRHWFFSQSWGGGGCPWPAACYRSPEKPSHIAWVSPAFCHCLFRKLLAERRTRGCIVTKEPPSEHSATSGIHSDDQTISAPSSPPACLAAGLCS